VFCYMIQFATIKMEKIVIMSAIFTSGNNANIRAYLYDFPLKKNQDVGIEMMQIGENENKHMNTVQVASFVIMLLP